MAINVITISGNVGKDAVLRVTPNGKHIATFSLPARSGYGENEKTSWLQCRMFGAMAEKLAQSVVKGTKVTVSGEFVIDEWTRQDGSQAQIPTILVRDIDLPPKGSGNGYQQQPSGKSTGSSEQYDPDVPF